MHHLTPYIRDEYRCPISGKHVVAFEIADQREEAAHVDPAVARQIALARMAQIEAEQGLQDLTAAMFDLTMADQSEAAA